VQAGDCIHIQSWDWYKGQVRTSDDFIKEIDDVDVNPATGPIYVEGAEPGDTLTVKIIEIKTEKVGVARFSRDEGQLHHKVHGPYGRFFTVTQDTIYLDENISFPLNPMLGVIGVAPESGSILTMPAGKHGGNLDNNDNTIGSTIYLPVKHQGAFLEWAICMLQWAMAKSVALELKLVAMYLSKWGCSREYLPSIR
jgi:amidase